MRMRNEEGKTLDHCRLRCTRLRESHSRVALWEISLGLKSRCRPPQQDVRITSRDATAPPGCAYTIARLVGRKTRYAVPSPWQTRHDIHVINSGPHPPLQLAVGQADHAAPLSLPPRSSPPAAPPQVGKSALKRVTRPGPVAEGLHMLPGRSRSRPKTCPRLRSSATLQMFFEIHPASAAPPSSHNPRPGTFREGFSFPPSRRAITSPLEIASGWTTPTGIIFVRPPPALAAGLDGPCGAARGRPRARRIPRAGPISLGKALAKPVGARISNRNCLRPSTHLRALQPCPQTEIHCRVRSAIRERTTNVAR